MLYVIYMDFQMCLYIQVVIKICAQVHQRYSNKTDTNILSMFPTTDMRLYLSIFFPLSF